MSTEASIFHRHGMRLAIVVALVLTVCRVAAAYLLLPKPLLPFVNLGYAVLFLLLPVTLVFAVSNQIGSVRASVGFIAAGLALNLPSLFLNLAGPVAVVIGAVGQLGLLIWTAGLGCLLSWALKEKNLLVPVAIFLLLFDIFLVLTPMGFTKQIMAAAPSVLPKVGASVPRAATEATVGKISSSGFIGPADFVFLGMFSAAMFRWSMRVATTFRWMIPVLAIYLILVLMTGIALPALVPIGLVTLVINLREFKLTKDEWASTGVVAAIGVGLIAWSVLRGQSSPPEADNEPAANQPVLAKPSKS